MASLMKFHSSMASSSSSARNPRPTQGEDDDDDPEDKLPLSQVLRIGNQDEPMEEDEEEEEEEEEEMGNTRKLFDPEDKLPLSQVLRIGNQEEPMEEGEEEEEEEEEEMENTRKGSDGHERFKRIKGRHVSVKDYVKNCATVMDRMIKVGDIVWVNRRWPGLVLKRGHRHATVSLYGSVEKPCKVIKLSEVYSFEEHFVSISKSIISDAHSNAVDCALEEFRRRFVLGVMCPCQVSSMKKANDDEVLVMKKKFQPKDVLRFVLGRAVSASVDHEEKLNGAKMVAQVHTFRRFVYVPTDDEKYRQELRLSESDSSSTDDESEPNTMDNVAAKEMSSEMVSEDSYKGKGTTAIAPPLPSPTIGSPALKLKSCLRTPDAHGKQDKNKIEQNKGKCLPRRGTVTIAPPLPSLAVGSPALKPKSCLRTPDAHGKEDKIEQNKGKCLPRGGTATIAPPLPSLAVGSPALKPKSCLRTPDAHAKEDKIEQNKGRRLPRGGTATIAPPLPSLAVGSPALKPKSCLRTPDAHGKEDKIEQNKGKWLPRGGTATIAPPLPSLAVGSPALKLKSCLRTPDAHWKEDKIQRNKGKCLPESRASSLPPSKKNDGTCSSSKSCKSSRETEPDILLPFLVLLSKCKQIIDELNRTKDEKGKGKGI